MLTNLICDAINECIATGADPLAIALKYAIMTHMFAFTDEDICDVLRGDRRSMYQSLADDPKCIKHIANRILGFANDCFADDVFEAADDYANNVKED